MEQIYSDEKGLVWVEGFERDMIVTVTNSSLKDDFVNNDDDEKNGGFNIN